MFVVGTTSSFTDFTLAGGFDTTFTGNDGYIVKLAFGALGVTCTIAAECHSGLCADGVCCDTACSRTCVACTAALRGSDSDGICGPIAADTDPRNACAAGSGTCAADGFCNGAGACRSFAKPSTPCGPTACSAGTLSGKICKGDSAACVDSTGVMCAPLCVRRRACKTSCAADTDCEAGAYCGATNTCIAKTENGKSCTDGLLASFDRRGATTYFTVGRISTGDGSVAWSKTWDRDGSARNRALGVAVHKGLAIFSGRIGIVPFDTGGDGFLLGLDPTTGAYR